jgi:tRNA(fMet)-specific endonuclease VapC
MYLLDTDRISILQQRSQPAWSQLSSRMRDCEPAAFCFSIVSFQEQVSGWNAYLSRARVARDVIRSYRMFEGILSDFSTNQVLPFDDAASEVFESLRKRRVRIGTLDLRIASIAIAKQLTLLSRNLKDFSKVPGLDVEDWTAHGYGTNRVFFASVNSIIRRCSPATQTGCAKAPAGVNG